MFQFYFIFKPWTTQKYYSDTILELRGKVYLKKKKKETFLDGQVCAHILTLIVLISFHNNQHTWNFESQQTTGQARMEQMEKHQGQMKPMKKVKESSTPAP